MSPLRARLGARWSFDTSCSAWLLFIRKTPTLCACSRKPRLARNRSGADLSPPLAPASIAIIDTGYHSQHVPRARQGSYLNKTGRVSLTDHAARVGPDAPPAAVRSSLVTWLRPPC